MDADGWLGVGHLQDHRPPPQRGKHAQGGQFENDQNYAIPNLRESHAPAFEFEEKKQKNALNTLATNV